MTAVKGANTASDGSRRYPIQGRSLPSVNTVAGALDKPGLNVWKLKKVAYGVAADPVLAEMARDGSEYRAARTCLDVETEEARIGTAVHWWTEVYDRGDDTSECPAEVRPFLDQWIEAREEFGLIPHLIEVTVANLTIGYAGTPDRAMASEFPDIADSIHEGCRLAHIADIKTGAKVYPDVALQMASYANAPYIWDPEHDELHPVERVCPQVGLVASLHEDDCTITPVWLDDAWQTFQAALIAHEWASEHSKQALGAPLARPTSGLPW